jgi:hypothetical protein
VDATSERAKADAKDVAMTEAPWWAVPALLGMVAGVIFGPAIVNLIVARVLGRPAAIVSVVITYFGGLLGIAFLVGRAMPGCTPPNCPPAPPGPWYEPIMDWIASWADSYIRDWYFHMPYILLGAVGAWVGLALRRRAARRRAADAQAADPGPLGAS